MAHTITNAKQIQKKSHGYIIRQIRPNWFKVARGPTGPVYDVNLGLNGGTCTCAWGRNRPSNDHRSGCSHVVAALAYRARQHGQYIGVWASNRDAQRQHRPTMTIGDGLTLTTRSIYRH
jgi:hypothetical protein